MVTHFYPIVLDGTPFVVPELSSDPLTIEQAAKLCDELAAATNEADHLRLVWERNQKIPV